MKNILSAIILFTLSLSLVSAEVWGTITRSIASSPTVYKTSEEFLKAEGNTCEVATDGCNTITIWNWALWASTMMYCEDIYGTNGQEKWSCKKQKEPVVEEGPTMCTMQYDPVCWVDWVTYGNSCSAWKVKVAYAGECNLESWVSEGSEWGYEWISNDESFYNHIKATLDTKYQTKVNTILKNYNKKIEKLSVSKKQKINTKIVSALENEINKLLMKYPQDTSLPTSINNAYLSITLLKMEIEKQNSK